MGLHGQILGAGLFGESTGVFECSDDSLCPQPFLWLSSCTFSNPHHRYFRSPTSTITLSKIKNQPTTTSASCFISSRPDIYFSATFAGEWQRRRTDGPASALIPEAGLSRHLPAFWFRIYVVGICCQPDCVDGGSAVAVFSYWVSGRTGQRYLYRRTTDVNALAADKRPRRQTSPIPSVSYDRFSSERPSIQNIAFQQSSMYSSSFFIIVFQIMRTILPMPSSDIPRSDTTRTFHPHRAFSSRKTSASPPEFLRFPSFQYW